jgi:hypothetical protein
MWSLATYRRGHTIGLAALREDGILVGPPEVKQWATMLDLVEDWAQAAAVLPTVEIDDVPVVEVGLRVSDDGGCWGVSVTCACTDAPP